tara:strand:+ start:176 stop:871 length:696 start_codon:yes stop_codon:yes gene_type:complete
MAIVKTTLLEDGDKPSAADLNLPYNSAATISADLEADNAGGNWITAYHMNDATRACNRLFSFSYDGTVADVITSTSYVTVNNGSDSEATINESFNDHDVLRVECSGLVTANIATDIFDDQVSGQVRGQDNYYAFQLLLTFNDGGGSSTVSLGEWGYSFTTMTADPYFDPSASGVSNVGTPLAFQTFQFSTILRNDTANRTYEKIALQAKVHNGSNTLKVTRNNITAIRAIN